MSIQEEVQKLLYDALKADAAVMGLVDAVYDDVTSNAFGGPKQSYITIGPSDVVTNDADCIDGADITFQFDSWSRIKGKRYSRTIVDAVKKALHARRDLVLAVNALSEIEVTFRNVVDDPDGLTKHGIVLVRVVAEEH